MRLLQVQILSISCSFWEHLSKLCVGAFPLRGNPGSATDLHYYHYYLHQDSYQGISELLLSNRASHILLQSLINTRRMYRLVTLTTVMLLLLLPGGHGEGQEVKVDQAQCQAACDMGIYYDGCKCFRQVLFFSICLEVF